MDSTSDTKTGYLAEQLEELKQQGLYNNIRTIESAMDGHIRVDGKKVDIPSYQVQPGQKVTWRESSRNSGLFQVITASTGMGRTTRVPSWLRVDPDQATGEMTALPNPMEGEVGIDTRQIVEYYSRR